MTLYRRTYHVYVENGESSSEIVLVEHPLELLVQKDGTSIESWPAPRVERAALKLGNGLRRRRAKVQMDLSVVRLQITGRPYVGIRACVRVSRHVRREDGEKRSQSKPSGY